MEEQGTNVELKGLRALRRHKGWTQQELADQAGTDQVAISQLERGQRTPRPPMLRRLATALGVEVEDLFKEPGAGALIVPKREAAPEETVAAWFVERCGDDLLIRPLQEVRDRAEDWSLANILGAITRLSLCNRAARAAMNDPNQSLDRSLHQGLREARRGYRDRLIELMNAGQLKAQREGRIEDYDRAIGEALLLSGADSEE